MDRSLLRPFAAALAAVAGVLAGVATVRRARRRTAPELFTSDPGVGTSAGTGAPTADERRAGPAARGRATSFGLDLDRLKAENGLEPVVQYLTYIQEKRGEQSHLLFVRYDDLDAMASIDGAPTPSFLERLEQLGVVVSTN
ncbi:MAG: hypothetical protein KY457_03490 [Actinobacteria bacterium]|nr:hypothetical protein [Actinomycetota bacterium]